MPTYTIHATPVRERIFPLATRFVSGQPAYPVIVATAALAELQHKPLWSVVAVATPQR